MWSADPSPGIRAAAARTTSANVALLGTAPVTWAACGVGADPNKTVRTFSGNRLFKCGNASYGCFRLQQSQIAVRTESRRGVPELAGYRGHRDGRVAPCVRPQDVVSGTGRRVARLSRSRSGSGACALWRRSRSASCHQNDPSDSSGREARSNGAQRRESSTLGLFHAGAKSVAANVTARVGARLNGIIARLAKFDARPDEQEFEERRQGEVTNVEVVARAHRNIMPMPRAADLDCSLE